MASTIGNKVIVCAAETILRVRLLHKVIFYSKEQLFTAIMNCDYKLREKKDLIGDFRYRWNYWKDSRIVRQKI